MATYVLIHGASSDAWYWHLVGPRLEALGHDVVAPDLPCEDDEATFADYADVVVDALGDRPDPIVVAQSLGGFTGPLVCARVPARLLVMLAAMVPVPGETGGDWWANVGFDQARRDQAEREGRVLGDELDPLVDFFHDVPDDVVAAALAHGERGQSGRPFADPWPLDAWPDVPTRALIGAHDRFFPAALQRRVLRDRLGITPDEIATGHLPALAAPDALVTHLETYRTTL
ncbi:MAG TPA: alpha/beta hydrolase [Iamia sp.]|jgi:pimeloyl-ACP methyl ester carboxylesterase|nr:alpha/beta hydrolase [Iamia sp.]